MDVAFVENSENNIHHENRGEKKERQTAKELAKDERFALEAGLHTRDLLLHLREAVFDEFRGIADRDVWKQVEVDGYACELVEVIDCLRTNDLLARCYSAQRHEIGGSTCGGCDVSTACSCSAKAATGVTAHIKVVKISRRRALTVLHFQDDLVLILGLFD